jgi:hypothetical protein
MQIKEGFSSVNSCLSEDNVSYIYPLNELLTGNLQGAKKEHGQRRENIVHHSHLASIIEVHGTCWQSPLNSLDQWQKEFFPDLVVLSGSPKYVKGKLPT